METLTELNALFTYQERCKNAAKQFISDKNSLECQNFASQEYWAKIIASSWQVEIVDMLAETNNERKRKIRRDQIAGRISALSSVLLTGELDAKHTKIVQEKITLLASQMYPTVKK